MAEQLKVHIDYLDKYGISDYQHFQQTLHSYLFKREDKLEFIISYDNF